jgi:AraC-like DNA-binding protein
MSIATDFWRDPRLPFVETRRACHSRACYRAHSHPTFSVGAVDAGGSRFRGAGEGAIALVPGMLVFVPAQRVHACNPLPGSAWSYQMLHVEADWLQQLRGEYVGSAIWADEPVRVRSETWLYRRFCQLNARLFGHASIEDKEAALIEFFGRSDLGEGDALDVGATAPVEALRSVFERLADDVATPVTLSELAALASCGRYQLIRRFRAATGLTPHAWQLNHRVNRARLLLREGIDLADVAYRLGFADQSHFQRVFKAHVGLTPGRYRA